MRKSNVANMIAAMIPDVHFFNDKLKAKGDLLPGRSIKVPGWSEKSYNKAVASLRKAGYDAKLVALPRGPFRRLPGVRMHIRQIEGGPAL